MSDSQNSSRNENTRKLLETGLELKKALESWEQLSTEAPKLSNNDKMLKDVQELLRDLKAQLEEFNP